MGPNPLLSAWLLALIAGCGRVDDTICLEVDQDAECPSPAAAEDQLKGQSICTTPVEVLVHVTSLDQRFPSFGDVYQTYTSPDTGDPDPEHDACCYSGEFRKKLGQGCVVGRPFLQDGAIVAAEPTSRPDWARGTGPNVDALGPDVRAALARHWTEAALLEHASIASFARFALDLMRFGAPPELVADAHGAALDEIGHAQDCFALASAYSGRPVGPGQLPIARGVELSGSFADFAEAVLREGCFGETVAASLAAVQLGSTRDPAVHAVLARIVREEAGHADLAWRALSWALAAGGPAVRARLAEVARALRAERPEAHAAAFSGHGVLSSEQAFRVAQRTLEAVVQPLAEAALRAA